MVTLRLDEQQPMGLVVALTHTHREKTGDVCVVVCLFVHILLARSALLLDDTTERWSRHINVPFHFLFILRDTHTVAHTQESFFSLFY